MTATVQTEEIERRVVPGRAREWLAANLRGRTEFGYRLNLSDEEELAFIAHGDLQRTIYDGGFAGICFPKEYGGMGLTPAHQRAFNLETIGYEYPTLLQVPSFVPCAVLLGIRLGGKESATSRRSFAARRSGCSSCPGRAVAPTSPVRSPPRCATATSG